MIIKTDVAIFFSARIAFKILKTITLSARSKVLTKELHRHFHLRRIEQRRCVHGPDCKSSLMSHIERSNIPRPSRHHCRAISPLLVDRLPVTLTISGPLANSEHDSTVNELVVNSLHEA